LGSAIGVALTLALASSAAALSPPVRIGANTPSLPSLPAVAVDPTGTAYIAWDASSNTTVLNFCKLPPAATACAVTQSLSPPAGTASLDPHGLPSIIVVGLEVFVFRSVEGGDNTHIDGTDEWVSTNGGASFTFDPSGGTALSFLPGDSEATTNPVIALPGGNVGFGAVVPGGSNPEFEANSLVAPLDYSVATTPPFATLNPSPNNYAIGNLGGQFASQLTGAMGVLGVFEMLEAGPCPSSEGLVYSFASLPAANAALNTNGAWRPLAGIDCNTTNPAVGGGPSGLGLLEDNQTSLSNPLVEYRRFTPPSTFGAPVTIGSSQGLNPSVSQDGTGGIYATWLESGTGVEFAYSGNGGASFEGPVALQSNGAAASLASAVGASGVGWAAYSVAGTEFAQPFSRADTIPPAPTNTSPPKITGKAKPGQTLTCSTGTWTGHPTKYGFQWIRNGVPLAGAMSSKYKVGTLDEGSTLSCEVIAVNAGGAGFAMSKGVKVPVPFVARCQAATGKMTGTEIGQLKLGITRAQARFVYRKHSTRNQQYIDYFCLTPMGIRAGYPTPKLLKTLSRHERKSVNGRVIWASTANPFYGLDGVHAGEPVATAEKTFGGTPEPPFHIGKNDWYLARVHGFTAVMKVRRGVVEELGIGAESLTKTRKAQNVLMHSFY
jgi:hypothetical protein